MNELEQFILLGLIGNTIVATLVGLSAAKVGAERGRLGGGLADMGPGSWFIVVMIIGLPAAWLWVAVRPAHGALNAGRQRDSEANSPMATGRRCGNCDAVLAHADRWCGRCGAPQPA